MSRADERLGLLVLVLALITCGRIGQDPLIGKWKEVEGDDSSEFLSDGSVVMADEGIPLSGRWKRLEDDQIKVDMTILGSAVAKIFSVKVDGERVTLTDGDGKSTTYARATGAAPVGSERATAVANPIEMKRNEATAIGDLRTIISGQAAYQASNGGFYDRLECLAKPVECIPSYPPDGPSFLEVTVLTAERSGYRWSFHPAEALDAGIVKRAGLSPTSIPHYVIVAVPTKPGSTGIRGFCGDPTGTICTTPDGKTPPFENGTCTVGPGKCEPI